MKSLLCMALSGAATAAAAQSSGATAVPPVVEVRSASTQPVATGSLHRLAVAGGTGQTAPITHSNGNGAC